MINTAKLFTNGRSQAIRLPKEYRFNGTEVYINKIDDIVIIIPKTKKLQILQQSLEKFTEDFMDSRNQPDNEKRDKI
jgi:antitoxin VapB